MKQKKREKEAEKGGYKLCDTKIEPNYDHSSPWILFCYAIELRNNDVTIRYETLTSKISFTTTRGLFLPKKTHFCLNCSISVSEFQTAFQTT